MKTQTITNTEKNVKIVSNILVALMIIGAAWYFFNTYKIYFNHYKVAETTQTEVKPVATVYPIVKSYSFEVDSEATAKAIAAKPEKSVIIVLKSEVIK